MKKIYLLILSIIPVICCGKTVGEASFRDTKNDILIEDFEEDFFDIEEVKVTYNGNEKLWIEFQTGGDIPDTIRSLARFIIWFDLDGDEKTGAFRKDIGMDIAAFVGKTSEIKEWNARVADYSKFAMEYEIDVTNFKVEDKKITLELTSGRFEDGDTFQLIFQSRVEDSLLDELGPVEIKLKDNQSH